MNKAPQPIRIDPDTINLEPLELEPEAFQSPLPIQHCGLIFEDEEIGLAVGISDTTTMQEAFGPYPGDEYITVLDGAFAMVNATGEMLAAARAGDSVTFRNGAPCSWKQDGYLRKVYLTLQDPTGLMPEIALAEGAFRLLDPACAPRGDPTGDGVTREVIFRNDAGTMTVALCTFPDRSLPLGPCPVHRLISEEISLTGPATPPDRFDAASHVFLPKGATCAWEAMEGTVAVIVDVNADRPQRKDATHAHLFQLGPSPSLPSGRAFKGRVCNAIRTTQPCGIRPATAAAARLSRRD